MGRVPLLVRIYVLVGALVVLVLATATGSFVFRQRTENAMSHLTDVVRPAQTSASELTRHIPTSLRACVGTFSLLTSRSSNPMLPRRTRLLDGRPR